MGILVDGNDLEGASFLIEKYGRKNRGYAGYRGGAKKITAAEASVQQAHHSRTFQQAQAQAHANGGEQVAVPRGASSHQGATSVPPPPKPGTAVNVAPKSSTGSTLAGWLITIGVVAIPVLIGIGLAALEDFL